MACDGCTVVLYLLLQKYNVRHVNLVGGAVDGTFAWKYCRPCSWGRDKFEQVRSLFIASDDIGGTTETQEIQEISASPENPSGLQSWQVRTTTTTSTIARPYLLAGRKHALTCIIQTLPPRV